MINKFDATEYKIAIIHTTHSKKPWLTKCQLKDELPLGIGMPIVAIYWDRYVSERACYTIKPLEEKDE